MFGKHNGRTQHTCSVQDLLVQLRHLPSGAENPVLYDLEEEYRERKWWLKNMKPKCLNGTAFATNNAYHRHWRFRDFKPFGATTPLRQRTASASTAPATPQPVPAPSTPTFQCLHMTLDNIPTSDIGTDGKCAESSTPSSNISSPMLPPSVTVSYAVGHLRSFQPHSRLTNDFDTQFTLRSPPPMSLASSTPLAWSASPSPPPSPMWLSPRLSPSPGPQSLPSPLLPLLPVPPRRETLRDSFPPLRRRPSTGHEKQPTSKKRKGKAMPHEDSKAIGA